MAAKGAVAPSRPPSRHAQDPHQIHSDPSQKPFPRSGATNAFAGSPFPDQGTATPSPEAGIGEACFGRAKHKIWMFGRAIHKFLHVICPRPRLGGPAINIAPGRNSRGQPSRGLPLPVTATAEGRVGKTPNQLAPGDLVLIRASTTEKQERTAPATAGCCTQAAADCRRPNSQKAVQYQTLDLKLLSIRIHRAPLPSLLQPASPAVKIRGWARSAGVDSQEERGERGVDLSALTTYSSTYMGVCI